LQHAIALATRLSYRPRMSSEGPAPSQHAPATAAPAAVAPRPVIPLFSNRNFVLLWAAYAISALGDHISEYGLLLMQDGMHGDQTTRIQAVMTFGFLAPFFVLAPLAGWVADRLPRKWVMIGADLVRAALLFSLFPLMKLTHELLHSATWFQTARLHSQTGAPILSPWFYTLPLVLTGAFAAIFSPSRAALLPTLINTTQLVRANALTNALGPLMTIGSAVLGAWLAETYGARVNFQVDAMTFIASALLILGIRPPPRRHAERNAHQGVMDGFRYVRTHRRLIELTIAASAFWITATVVRSIIPAYVKDVIYGSLQDVGLHQAIIGVGILSGAGVLTALGHALKPELAVSWSLVGAGLSVLLLAITTQVTAIAALGGKTCLFFAGFYGSGILVGVNALIQQIVPDRYRGRVISVNDFFSMAGVMLAVGSLAVPDWPGIDRFVPAILAVTGATMLVLGIMAVRRRLRRGKFGPVISFWTNFNYLFFHGWHRLRRDGICTIPATGPAIVVSNHVSSLDPVAIIAASPNRYVSYMIAREYYSLPLLGRLIKRIDCVPVNRTGIDTASIKAALRHLEMGKLLGIFPQGGIRPPGDGAPPREGVGLLALRSEVPVIPVFLSGISNGESMITPIIRRQRVVVRFGRPVDLSRFRGRTLDRDAYREAAEEIFKAIQALDPSRKA